MVQVKCLASETVKDKNGKGPAQVRKVTQLLQASAYLELKMQELQSR
jgi:hypothetical protein